MKIELRDPNTIMKLSRLGSFHQSKLSFLRSFLSEFKDWDYKRDLFNLLISSLLGTPSCNVNAASHFVAITLSDLSSFC